MFQGTGHQSYWNIFSQWDSHSSFTQFFGSVYSLLINNKVMIGHVEFPFPLKSKAKLTQNSVKQAAWESLYFMLSFACLNTPNFRVGNGLSFLSMLQTVHCFSFPKAKYVFLFPRKIFLHLLAMTHPFISEGTASVIRTQDDQMDWDRFHTKFILTGPWRFKTRPTDSSETSDIQNMKLYHGLKYSCLPIATETECSHP